MYYLLETAPASVFLVLLVFGVAYPTVAAYVLIGLLVLTRVARAILRAIDRLRSALPPLAPPPPPWVSSDGLRESAPARPAAPRRGESGRYSSPSPLASTLSPEAWEEAHRAR